jgi:hypothetical protein
MGWRSITEPFRLPAYLPVNTVRALSGVIPDQQNGFGTIGFSYPQDGLQERLADGVALVQGAAIIQFLSYEGTMTASNGPAAGMASTDIGRSESGDGPIGESLRLAGAGTGYSDRRRQAQRQRRVRGRARRDDLRASASIEANARAACDERGGVGRARTVQ